MEILVKNSLARNLENLERSGSKADHSNPKSTQPSPARRPGGPDSPVATAARPRRRSGNTARAPDSTPAGAGAAPPTSPGLKPDKPRQ